MERRVAVKGRCGEGEGSSDAERWRVEMDRRVKESEKSWVWRGEWRREVSEE